MQLFSSIILLTLNDQSARGDVDCGNCNKSSSAYEPVCAVGEQDWFRYIIYHILINYITFLICALAKPALDKK